MLSFTFAGKNSYTDYGIAIATRPTLPSPKRRVTFMEIPGRHSSVRYDEGTYEDITLVVECSLRSKDNLVGQIDALKGWLFPAGEDDLIFSFQDDRKYLAQVVNAIDFTQVFRYTSTFPIVFSCRPFKYTVDNELVTLTTSGTLLENPGTVKSQPIISVYGTGNVNLNINGQLVALYDLEDKIILNSEIQDAYDDAMTNLNSKMTGEFPVLSPGSNTIEWLGTVQKLDILPNWRWL